jgi:hypothetical protein
LRHKSFCNGLPGGLNLQFDKSDNLFLCCALEEQQRNIGLFQESLVLFTGVLFDSLGRIQVELEACQMGDKFLLVTIEQSETAGLKKGHLFSLQNRSFPGSFLGRFRIWNKYYSMHCDRTNLDEK